MCSIAMRAVNPLTPVMAVLATSKEAFRLNNGGSDCGFGTFAGFGAVDPEIAYAKLASLAEGARLASSRL